MKQLKIVSLLLALVMLFSLAACSQEAVKKTTAPAETAEKTVQTAGEATTAAEETADEATVKVLIADEGSVQERTVDLADLKEGATLQDAITSEAYADVFEATLDNGMITAIGGLEPDASKSEYIFIYTTDTTTEGIVDVGGEYTTTVELEGVTYYSANVGAGELTLAAGESYLFQIATF